GSKPGFLVAAEWLPQPGGGGIGGRGRPLLASRRIAGRGAAADHHLSVMSPALQIVDPRVAAVAQAIERPAQQLLSQQDRRGFWRPDWPAAPTLERNYLLLNLGMPPPQDGVWNPASREFVDKAAQSILARQLPDGGFNVYVKGPSDISATVKAYFALKLAGIPYDDPRLTRARELILAKGGIQAANSYVKINLSLFDLYPRDAVPSVP